MFGFLIGWGIFWLFIWTGLFAMGKTTKETEITAASVGGIYLSLAWLAAVAAGKLAASL